MPPRRRKRKQLSANKIDANDAAEVAEYAAAVAEEFQNLDEESLSSVFYGSKSYIRVTSASIRYTQTVEVERAKKDQDDEDSDNKTRRVERQAEVGFDLDIYRPTNDEIFAPYELANGIVGPAESARKEVERLLADALGHPLGIRLPIFTVSKDLFWVNYENENYTINIGTGEIIRLEDIQSLNNALKPMFDFISRKATLLYD